MIIGLGLSAAILVPIAATAAFQEGPYTYTVDNGQAAIIDFDTYYPGDLAIPSSLDSCSVTFTSDQAFEHCAALTGMIIPGSVASIEIDTLEVRSDLNVIYPTDTKSCISMM